MVPASRCCQSTCCRRQPGARGKAEWRHGQALLVEADSGTAVLRLQDRRRTPTKAAGAGWWWRWNVSTGAPPGRTAIGGGTAIHRRMHTGPPPSGRAGWDHRRRPSQTTAASARRHPLASDHGERAAVRGRGRREAGPRRPRSPSRTAARGRGPRPPRATRTVASRRSAEATRRAPVSTTPYWSVTAVGACGHRELSAGCLSGCRPPVGCAGRPRDCPQNVVQSTTATSSIRSK